MSLIKEIQSLLKNEELSSEDRLAIALEVLGCSALDVKSDSLGELVIYTKLTEDYDEIVPWVDPGDYDESLDDPIGDYLSEEFFEGYKNKSNLVDPTDIF